MRYIIVLLTLLSLSTANAATVHAGSFSVWTNAKKIKTRINRLGYDAAILQKRINGKRVHSVVIKNMSNSSALNICDKLKHNSISCYVNRNNSNYSSNKRKKKYRAILKPRTRGNEYRRSRPQIKYRQYNSNATNSDDAPLNKRYLGRQQQNRTVKPRPYISGPSDFNL